MPAFEIPTSGRARKAPPRNSATLRRVLPNDGGVSVRLAEFHESELVLSLTLSGFEEYRTQPLPSSALRETLEDVQRSLGEGGAVIASIAGEPVGCARFRCDGETLTFSRMAVVPSARRCGVGRALVAFLEAYARRLGARRVELTARSEQPDNRPYYQRLGYEVVGFSERYGLAKLVTHMRKSLT